MVMRAEYYMGTTADSPFYVADRASWITPVSADEDRLQSDRLPAGWLLQCWSGWEGWTPRDWRPRLQGWKIHVSATPDCAEATLAVTTRICVLHQVAFKFLPTLSELNESSNKQGSRGGAGKFITIYPDDDDQLATLLTELADGLQGQQGPYILSDLRFGDVPVFVRYGGIMAMDVPNTEDVGVSSIAHGESLTLIPDVRAPRFVVPEGVELPEILHASYERSRERSDSRLSEFTAIRPLHFSNAGGVYKATLPDGSLRVLREARPHAGLDSRNRCALQRQLVEQQVLEDLVGVPGVQQILGSFTAWEHRYLELEYVDGSTLTAWVVRNISEQQDDPDGYARRAVSIARQLIDIVQRIHDRGWAVGDLHTGNVLVDEHDTVTILDLEDATRLDETRAIGFRVFEFCADEDLTAEQADWFAVARSIMMLYVADWEIESVAPGYWAASKAKVGATYGEAAEAQLTEVEQRYPAGARSVLACTVPVGVTEELPSEADAVRALTAGIEWSRGFSTKSSYPGDITQPGRSPHEILSSGRAGVVFAQQRLGLEPDESDLTALTAVAESWDPGESPGLLSGLAGLALVLSDAGRYEAAVNAARRALERSWARRRLDLFGGQAGTVLAALEVGRAAGSAELLDDALTTYDRLHRTVVPDTSAWTSLTRRRGYFWGLTGLALTDLAAHIASGDSRHLARAIDRLRLDVDACVTIATGESMIRDTENHRVLPYVEWGSAGVWTVVTVAERISGQTLLSDEERAGFALACSSDFYIYPSLDHGRAGILTTLAAGGEPYAAEADRQSRLLRESLLHRDDMAFSIGDGLLRLSSDLSTGAAGVALALHSHRTRDPYLSLPVSVTTARTLGQLPLPGALDREPSGVGRSALVAAAGYLPYALALAALR